MLAETTRLANTVTAYATILAGLLALILSALMGRQPRRLKLKTAKFPTGGDSVENVIGT